jgi:hypothetical protein
MPLVAPALCGWSYSIGNSTTTAGPWRIKLRDKLAALTALIKHLGGLPDERPVGVHNTQVNVITDVQRVGR